MRPRGNWAGRKFFGKNESVEQRKLLLGVLAQVVRKKGVSDEGRWIKVRDVNLIHIRLTTTSLLKLRLIETRNSADGELEARITQLGLWALERGRFTSVRLKDYICVPLETYIALGEMAVELDIRRHSGRGAGKEPGIAKMLTATTARRGEFVRWFKSVYPNEYREDLDDGD